jgi:hypothetical protein
MRLTRKDAVVTAIVAAVVVPYLGYLARGSMPFIQDPRGMAGVGLVGLLAGFAVWASAGRSAFGSAALVGTAMVIGLVALGLGIAALALESEALLATFIITLAVLWAIEVLSHAGLLPGGEAPRHA